MTEQQIPKLLAVLVEHQKHFEPLSNEEAQLVITNGVAAIAVFVAAIKVAYAKTIQLLEFLGIVTLAPTTEKFIAVEKFVYDISAEAKVKISCFGDNFSAWFLANGGKIEDPISEQTLRYAKLKQSSLDAPIIAELGGEAKAETTLQEIYGLMSKQARGEAGALLNNGWANIFYVRDKNGVLRAVGVGWDGDGWHVGAHSVEYPSRWFDGYQVFSRNSVLVSSELLAPAQA